MQTLSFQCPDEMAEKLEYFAKLQDRSKAYLVRKAIDDMLEDLEDIALIEEAMKDYDPSQNKTLDEVVKMLGINA